MLTAGTLSLDPQLILPPELFSGLTISSVTLSDGVKSQQSGDIFFHPDRMMIRFDSALDTTGGASGTHSVLNRANWSLTKDGVDVSQRISGIQIDQRVVTLLFSEPLPAGNYQLAASGQIEAADHKPLATREGDTAWHTNTFTVTGLTENTPVTETPFDLPGTVLDMQSDAQGNFVVLFNNFDPSSGITNIYPPQTWGRIYAQRYNSQGVALGAPFQVGGSYGINDTHLAMNAAGAFVVIWTQSFNVSVPDSVPDYVRSSPFVYAQAFDAEGNPVGEQVRVATSASTGPIDTSVAINANGSFAIAWSSRAPGEHVRVQKFAADGTAIGEAIDVGIGTNPQVALNSSDNIVITWQAGESAYVCWLWADQPNADGSYPSGHSPTFNYYSLSAPRVATSLPSIAMDSSGGFTVAWYQKGNGIMAQQFDNIGTRIRNPFLVAAINAPERIGITIDGDGRLVFSWTTSSAGLRSQSEARIFGPDGTPATPAFAIDGPLVSVSDGILITANYHDRNSYSPHEKEYANSWLPHMEPLIIIDDAFTGIRIHRYELPRTLAVDLNGDASVGNDYRGNFIPGGAAVAVTDAQQLLLRAGGATQLTRATISIAGYRGGDTLIADVSGTQITATLSGGVLTLSGIDSVENYQRVLRSVKFATTAPRGVGTTVEINIAITDDAEHTASATSRISLHVPGRSSIAGRHIFYNNSAFDGNDGAGNAADDAAIAIDKQPLRAGADLSAWLELSPQSITSYSRGINGLMIDLLGDHGTITADDFDFRFGTDLYANTWADAPRPLSIVVRPGAGENGADRIEIIWADGAIVNRWLQVTMRANGNTGLSKSDVFYVGNIGGETGNTNLVAQLTTDDALGVVNFLLTHSVDERSAAIDSVFDFDRDGHVNKRDLMFLINQLLSLPPEFRLSSLPPVGSSRPPLSKVITSYVLHNGLDSAPDPLAVDALTNSFENLALDSWMRSEEDPAPPPLVSQPMVLMIEPDRI